MSEILFYVESYSHPYKTIVSNYFRSRREVTYVYTSAHLLDQAQKGKIKNVFLMTLDTPELIKKLLNLNDTIRIFTFGRFHGNEISGVWNHCINLKEEYLSELDLF